MSRKKANVHKSLNRLNTNSQTIEVDLEEAKFVIFSDHHRGRKDRADDFLNNENTYLEALQHYLENDYHLILLGDIEEFWENPLGAVLKSYPEVMQVEKDFADKGKITRIWGNHDDMWKVKGFFKKYLGNIFPDMEVHESVRLSFTQKGKKLGDMLLVHGHQGSVLSDRFAGVSRFFVRYGWRYLQKWFNIPLTTPANNIELKSDHDLVMYEWASPKSNQVIVSGHTHQPVFMSLTHANFLKAKIKKLEAEIALAELSDKTTIASLKKVKAKSENELERILKDYHTTTIDVDDEHRKPCYFNSGCCSFSDGDITGLEIDHGHIRLFKWSIHNGRGRVVLEDGSLEQIFHACH